MTATEICFGRGTASVAVGRIAAFGSRVLLVHGANAARSDWLAEALVQNGCDVARFAVAGEPDMDMVQAGIDAARRHGADVVTALGGGAAIDAGKAIAALASGTRPMLDHLEVVGAGLPLETAPLPFVALPTTAGTGAEVTRNAVIAVPEHQRKVSLRDPRMLPRLALVDPALTDNCPRSVTLASGLDAVTQVIEPYLCTRANPMTDALCRDAIPRGLVALCRLMKGEDTAAREEIAWVSLCGGLALANAGLGVVHGLAGPLGGLSSAPHGAICGALLPHALEVNARHATDPRTQARIAEIRHWIAEALGGAKDEAFSRLAAWSRENGLSGLDALGISPEQRSTAAEAAAASSSMKANPVPLGPDTLSKLMDNAT
ncbi:iron-containing alcohol dehydrogenase [Primorskyibacter aestuariivivens]|uniref:iron-containing alcohol dehydrogenase n=1 Tax=Primorskyibacter aestuariivivens TaxID=1888912 RepID=UPI002301C485|nr:iron-containing alcohol dehydrogenase [Primorskyibacter aestuariivivens]MDA7427235.1 iron-containing alcohol dehydrogenase [Primorskyibacter aestuariivivens]